MKNSLSGPPASIATSPANSTFKKLYNYIENVQIDIYIYIYIYNYNYIIYKDKEESVLIKA